MWAAALPPAGAWSASNPHQQPQCLGVPQARRDRANRAAPARPHPPPEKLVIPAFVLLQQLAQWFLHLQHIVLGSDVPLSHYPVVPLSHCPRVRDLGLPTAELSKERRSKHEHPIALIPRSPSRTKTSRNTMEPMDSIRMNHPRQTGSQNLLNFLSFPCCMHSICPVVGAGAQ